MPRICRPAIGEAHGRQEYVGEGNCLALVLRSEGLMALPLITTSVTRNVKVDIHAEVRDEHDFLREVEKLYFLFC